MTQPTIISIRTRPVVRRSSRPALVALAAIVCLTHATLTSAAPLISRLTPPSNLFSAGKPGLPIVSRFIQGQRFDLQATVQPDDGQTIESVVFFIDNQLVRRLAALAPANAAGLKANSVVASVRAQSLSNTGVHTLRVIAVQSDKQIGIAAGDFEIVRARGFNSKVKNLIVLIGDGMGIAHRTAARIMLNGVSQGKVNDRLAMDTMPFTGLVMTHSLNSIVTDSSPGSHCYSSGNKGNNNQHGVFPDDTTANFDNPRIELITEYLSRVEGKSLGLVTTSDVFDATPAAWASHTQARGAGTGICDQYLDDAGRTNLRVLMGGGRKWFLPSTVLGTARAASTDYELPAELYEAWGVSPGAVDPERDLLGDFIDSGWRYAATAAELASIPKNTDRLLGLFALSNMNVSLDKIAGRRGNPAVVNDYGFPNQPMLDEMTDKALQVLSQNRKGFVLMVEGASIDKQAHNMDSERWILDTIEFDRAIDVALRFARKNRDTLVVVTADHECAGVNIIGASRVTDADLQVRAASGVGIDDLRRNVVGTYEAAGFPSYVIAGDGFPVTTDVDRRMLIGYAANADRYEDWRTNLQPLRDGQQPFNGVPPLSTYPNLPTNRDVAGNFLITGQIHDTTAAHTASDIPVSAFGPGSWQFTGVMDNTDVFFKCLAALLGGWDLDLDEFDK